MWRRHSCLPRRHSCRRSGDEKCGLSTDERGWTPARKDHVLIFCVHPWPIMPFQRLFLGDIFAEVETGTGRESHRETAVFQQIVEQVIVDQVRLRAPGDMPVEEHVEAAAEPVE